MRNFRISQPHVIGCEMYLCFEFLKVNSKQTRNLETEDVARHLHVIFYLCICSHGNIKFQPNITDFIFSLPIFVKLFSDNKKLCHYNRHYIYLLNQPPQVQLFFCAVHTHPCGVPLHSTEASIYHTLSFFCHCLEWKPSLLPHSDPDFYTELVSCLPSLYQVCMLFCFLLIMVFGFNHSEKKEGGREKGEKKRKEGGKKGLLLMFQHLLFVKNIN